MKSESLRALHQHPAGMAAALFRDGSVIAMRGGLAGGRNESEISRGFIGGGKAGDIAQHGEQSLRDGKVDAGQSHQQFDARIVVGLLSECAGEIENLLFDVTELPELTIERLAAERIDVELAEPGERARREEIVVRSGNQALVQNGVDAILDAGAVGDEVGALGGLMAEGDGGLVGDPHARKKVCAQKIGQHQRVHLVGFDFRFGDGARAQRVGDHHLGNEWLEQANDGPGVGSGFNSDVSVGGKVAGEVREGFPGGGKVVAMEDSSGVVEDYGFDDFLVQIERGKWHNKFTPVCGERAGSFSVQRERPPETRLPVTRFWMGRVGGRRRQGQNGTYLFELAVQPGGPEGRPDTTAGSKPISVVGRPQGVRPCSPWMVGCSSHLVPSPVSNSRSQLARGWQVPAKQLPAGVYAMPRSYHARYDVLNHLIQVTMPRYNASSQITTTQTRTFNYTTSNQVGSLLLSATNPENGTVTYTYGANNLIATKLDANNQKTVYSYDSYNRVTEIQHFYYQLGGYIEDTSQQVLYTYDSGTYGQGRLTGITYQPMANSTLTMALPTFSESYTYTQPGSVASKQLSISQYNQTGPPYGNYYGQVALSASFTYDNEGKMTSVTYPSVSNHSGTFTTTYDAMSRPSSMTDGPADLTISNVSYGPSNELLSIGYGCNGCSTYIENRTYNSRLQLTSINSLQYIYPTNGTNNGKAIEQKVTSGEDVVYSYDALNRLITANTTAQSTTNWGQSFVYDGFGNLYQKNQTQGMAPTLTAVADPATNRLSLGAYDANGNLVGLSGSNSVYYNFDVENRMVSVNTTGSTGGVPTYFYGYDPGNRRVWKGTYNSSGGLQAQEAYFYAPNGQKLGTYFLVLTYPPLQNANYAAATDLNVYFGAKRVGHATTPNGPSLPPVMAAVSQDRVGSFGSYFPYGEDKGTPLLPNDQVKFATYTRDSATGLDYAMN